MIIVRIKVSIKLLIKSWQIIFCDRTMGIKRVAVIPQQAKPTNQLH